MQDGIKREEGFCWLTDAMDTLAPDDDLRKVIEVGRGSYFTGYDDPWNARPFFDHIHYVDLALKLNEKLKIGKFVSIAPDIKIILGSNQNHPLTAVSQHPLFNLDKDGDWRNLRPRGDTIIGDGAWIGRGATIMPSVTIGEGARILPSAVVVKDVVPYAIAGGVPAVVKHKRFNDEKITLLTQKIRWTEWPDEVISENVKELLSLKPDFPKLIQIAEKLEKDGVLAPYIPPTKIGKSQMTFAAFSDCKGR